MNLHSMLLTDPDSFMQKVLAEPKKFTAEFAVRLDADDPLNLRALFDIQNIIPFAGHSLGPVFKPAQEEILRMMQLQNSHLHAGHFPETFDLGGNWFDGDVELSAIQAMQAMLGFTDPSEFLFSQSGLSVNLGNLLSTFYMPTLNDWKTGKTKIAYLSTEFFSDQAIIHTVIDRERQRANLTKPENAACHLPFLPNEKGLYDAQNIIDIVQQEAAYMQVLHLSDIVFSTGQKLDIAYILHALKNTIREHNIIVGLDLAHSAGNRTIDLKALKVVTYAVGCAYKHCCGIAGSPFGFYVNKHANLQRYLPIQGWKAADSEKIFDSIASFDESIMQKTGAWAFRASNTCPIALAPIKTFVKKMASIGWGPLMNQSECLTRYLRAFLDYQLSDRIQWITPEAPHERGAMLVFSIKGIENIKKIEADLLEKSQWGQFEVDSRPPNNMRITAHYAYTRFMDIHALGERLAEIIGKQ